MNTSDLIKFIEKQLDEFKSDLVESETNDLPLDYAYADGAYNAYELILKKLTETKED